MGVIPEPSTAFFLNGIPLDVQATEEHEYVPRAGDVFRHQEYVFSVAAAGVFAYLTSLKEYLSIRYGEFQWTDDNSEVLLLERNFPERAAVCDYFRIT